MTALVDFLGDLLGGLEIAALSLAVGGVVWGLFVLRSWRRPPEAEGQAVASCTRLLLAGAVGVALTQLIGLAVKACILAETLGRSPFPAFLHTPLFRAGLSRASIALGLASAAVWLGRRPGSRRRWAGVAVLVVLLIASGAWLVHAVSRLEDRVLLMVLTTLHETAAAAWVGGVVQLVVLWRLRRHRPEVDALWPVALRRFSSVGVVAVLVLVATGGALGWFYVGSWQGLIGTGYGALVVAKSVLLTSALGLAGLNFRAARGWSRGRGLAQLRTRVPYFVEAEGAVLLALLFAAAALSSQPPSVDTRTEVATWSEVVEVFAPKPPRLTSPPRAAALVSNGRDPLAPYSEQPALADAWSEFNHNVAGLLVLGTALLALLERTKRVPWGRHWPLGLVVLAFFLLLRNDPETWPLGPVPLRRSLLDVHVLQHWLAMLLAATLGVLEWWARSPRAGRRLPYLFPALALGGGILLLTHAHSPFEMKSEFLTQISHTAMGLLAVHVACGRWLELRLGPPAGSVAGLGAIVAMLLIGAILVVYRETTAAPLP